MFNPRPAGSDHSQGASFSSAIDRELARHPVDKPYQLDQTRVNDKSYVLSQVSRNGLLLAQAPFELRNDMEVVQAAVKENGYALQYASLDLRALPEVVEFALEDNGWLIGYAAPELHGDKSLFLKALAKNGYACNFLSNELRNDIDVAKTVAEQLGYLPKAVFSEKIRNHPEVKPLIFNADDIIKPPI